MAEATAFAGTGRDFKLQPGTYEFVDIDGAADMGVAYVKAPRVGARVRVADRPDIHLTDQHE